MMQWLRRNFVAGFFVMVPVVISIAALVWIVGVVDGITGPISSRLFGRQVPGLGILTTAVVLLAVGAAASNMIGKRLLQRGEGILLRVPVFRTIYAPVKQIVLAFSPDNEAGFKRVVLVHEVGRRFVLGFLTKEFTVDRGHGAEAFIAVYVPTNHLYLGDVVVYPREQVTFPDLSVEEGLRIFLTGGMSLPPRIRNRDESAERAPRSFS
jgi:uncharacterized membrane protein